MNVINHADRLTPQPIPRFPVDIAIDIIRARVDNNGIQHQHFAAAVGCSRKHLSQIFMRTREPSVGLLRRMWTEAMR